MLTALVAGVVWRRPVAGARPFALLLVAAAEWASMAALEHASVRPATKILFAKIEYLGIPMVQHGTEFMYDKGVGGRAFEWVLWFGPKRRFERGPSSMPSAKGTMH